MKISTLLIVKNLKEAKQFYVEVMGLTLIKICGNRLDLEADGHQIHIFEGEGNARPYRHSSDASSTLVFGVANLETKKLELEALGYKFIHTSENEFSRYGAFWGPSGIVHEISESINHDCNYPP